MGKLELLFNSAITGTDESGRWDETAHRELILPLRGKIMQLDGVTGMFIARYGMEVNYLPHIIEGQTSADKEQTLITVIQQAIDELISDPDSQLFPLRGDKQPTVQKDGSQPTYRKKVIARFNTDLVAYTNDDDSWKRTQNTVGEKLANLDGVRGYAVTLRALAIVFDTRHTTEDLVKDHMASVLKFLSDRYIITSFFPFLKGELNETYEVKDVN